MEKGQSLENKLSKEPTDQPNWKNYITEDVLLISNPIALDTLIKQLIDNPNKDEEPTKITQSERSFVIRYLGLVHCEDEQLGNYVILHEVEQESDITPYIDKSGYNVVTYYFLTYKNKKLMFTKLEYRQQFKNALKELNLIPQKKPQSLTSLIKTKSLPNY